MCDPERVRARAHDLAATDAEFKEASWAAAAGGGEAPIDVSGASFRSLADVRWHALQRGQSWWSTSPFLTADEGVEAAAPRAESGDEHAVPSTSLGWQPVPGYRGDQASALRQVREWIAQGWATVLVAAGQGTLDRAAEVLRDEGIQVTFMQRTQDGSTHSGQIAFPGGAREAEDHDLVATALREL